MTSRIALIAFAILGSLGAPAALAGLLDDPPPTLADGRTAVVVYRLGPVHFDPDQVDTIVTCSNAGDQPVEVVLELFDETDVRVGVARGQGSAGDQITFSTAAEPDAITVAGLPPLEHGKGRVSAGSASISCAAKHRVRGDDGTIKESSVELMKKVAR